MNDKQWVRDHTAEGFIMGEFTSTDDSSRPMAVLQTLDGPAVAPRSRLIPVDAEYMTRSLSHRFEDMIAAATKAGFTPDAIRHAVELAMERRDIPAESQHG